ncbi:MAG: LysR family transcriptional regulator [Burkholderiales bacterium]
MNEIDLRRIDLNLLVTFEVIMAERSVTRAADRLGRTQSAVSHALARLREQVGDPLLVKSGSVMKPSPHALELIEELRPILRNVQRVLGPRKQFEPATTRRSFRLGLPDLAMSLFPRFFAAVHDGAPGVTLEWVTPRESMLLDVAEGQLDAALVPSSLKLPDGVESSMVGALRWACFARKGHPGFARWGLKTWARWPHASVGVGDTLRSPVSAAAAGAGVARRIAAHVPNFAAVAPLLASTDLLATLPTVVMVDALSTFGIEVRSAPLRIEPLAHAIVWSSRLRQDPANRWIRQKLEDVIGALIRSAEEIIV